MQRYRIDNSVRTKHTAIVDCNLLAKVYINLIGQKEPTLDFKNQDIEIQDNNKNILYFKKIIKVTDQEKQNHSKYLKKEFKKNFFN